MKNLTKYFFAAISTLFLLTGCNDLQTNIAPAKPVTIHKEGIITPGHANFHGKLIRDNGWSMEQCKTCHAADFSGGVANASCRTCHTSSRGPEACNTCHGVFADSTRIAPPRDIDGNTSTSLLTVGAHTKHIYENTLSDRLRCSTCHVVPQSLYSPGHMDGKVDVQLKNLATAQGSNAVFNNTNGTCSNTYCHGNFVFYKDSAKTENQFAYTADKITGTPKTVTWTKTGEAECGSCHGLPPAGHIAVIEGIKGCYSCHPGVVDENGNILDKTKHINGSANSRGE